MSGSGDWLSQHARRRANHPALVHAKGTLSFAELETAALTLAGRLRGLGIGEGNRVAVLLNNDPVYVVLVHALAALGAVLVPLNLRLTPGELRELLEAAEPSLLIHGGALGKQALEAARCLPAVRVLATAALNTLPEKPGRSLFGPRLDLDQAILFTSGTTGRPKGVRLSLANHLASALGSEQRLGVDEGDRWLLCLPLYHVGGLAVVLRSVIYGTTVVLHESFDARTVRQALERDRISAVSLVPTMLTRLLQTSDAARFPDSLRFALLGGGPIAPELVARARRRSIRLAPTYGLTEAASQVCTLVPEELAARGDSVGRPLAGLELRVLNERGRDQSPGTPGEICVRGPQVTAGYLNPPKERERVLASGWLCTGDIGALSPDGYLTLLDRRSDLIVSGGENIYPSEVESVLLSHPDVAAAAVVGRADPEWGQVVHAFIVAETGGRPRAEQLVAHCRAELAGFKLPRRVHFVAALPLTASGKLRRAELRRRISPGGLPGPSD